MPSLRQLLVRRLIRSALAGLTLHTVLVRLSALPFARLLATLLVAWVILLVGLFAGGGLVLLIFLSFLAILFTGATGLLALLFFLLLLALKKIAYDLPVLTGRLVVGVLLEGLLPGLQGGLWLACMGQGVAPVKVGVR